MKNVLDPYRLSPFKGERSGEGVVAEAAPLTPALYPQAGRGRKIYVTTAR